MATMGSLPMERVRPPRGGGWWCLAMKAIAVLWSILTKMRVFCQALERHSVDVVDAAIADMSDADLVVAEDDGGHAAAIRLSGWRRVVARAAS